jgi:hypothetical protein
MVFKLPPTANIPISLVSDNIFELLFCGEILERQLIETASHTKSRINYNSACYIFENCYIFEVQTTEE